MNNVKKHNTDTAAFDAVAKLLASIAESSEDIDALLASVAEYYDADRAYVFEITPAGKAVDNTYEWCRDGVSAEIGNLQNVPIESVALWLEEFEKSGAFYISSLEEDVEKSSLTYEYLEPQGIESLITAPLCKGGVITGFVGVDNPRRNGHDLLILKTASSVICSDIRMAIAEKQEADKLVSVIASMAEDFDYVNCIDLTTREITRFRGTERFDRTIKLVDANLPANERLDEFLRMIIHPDDWEMFREKSALSVIRAELEKNPVYKFEVRTLTLKDKIEEWFRFKFAYLNGDSNQLVLGILNIDEQVRREQAEALEKQRAQLETMSVLSAMAEDFDYIAAINQKDKSVTRYWMSGKYKGLNELIDKDLPPYERLDRFFRLTVHPDDWDLFMEKSDFKTAIAELEKHPSYKFEVRSLFEGREEYYRIKFAYKPDDHDVVIMGILNIDEQVRREQEMAVQKEKAAEEILFHEQMGRVMELSDDFQAIFDVDYDTGRYEIFSYDNAYFEDVLVQMEKGENFYADTLKDVEKVVWPDDRDLIRDTFSNREYIGRTLAERGRFSIDYRLIGENGNPAWYRVKVVKKSGDGNHFLVGVFFVDEIVRREAEYKRSIEEELKVISGLAGDFVSLYTVDLDANTYKVYSITDTVKDIGTVVEGYSNLSNALRQYADGYVHEDDREKLYYYADLDNMRDALANARSRKITVRRNIDGEWKWIEFNMIKCDPIDERANSVILAFSNRDEQVKQDLEIRDQLQGAMMTAQEASLAKTNFLFNMSHDIRTPMNAITGFTNMALKNIGNDEKVRDCLDKTQKAGAMLLSLINNVLEVSRIEAGQAAVEEQPGDLYLSFANISSTMQQLAATKDINLEFSFGSIEDRYVYADFSRTMRIFVNIISNAIKYTPEGGYVKVKCEQAGKAKDGVATYRYTFEDNGIGMSGEFLEHIYDQFTREASSTVSGVQGTGLGMSVVKSFVDLLGGDISVKSVQGEGTTFTVLLPFRLQDEATYTDPKTGEVISAEGGNENHNVEVSFQGKNVLLVEDNELNREIATEILEDEGMMVDSADDGTTALEVLKERGIDFYDFILMDIQMPKMNGYDATRAIRELYPDTHIPIIAVSANAFEEDRRKSLESGMDDHVPKPIDVNKLKETLARFL